MIYDSVFVTNIAIIFPISFSSVNRSDYMNSVCFYNRLVAVGDIGFLSYEAGESLFLFMSTLVSALFYDISNITCRILLGSIAPISTELIVTCSGYSHNTLELAKLAFFQLDCQ